MKYLGRHVVIGTLLCIVLYGSIPAQSVTAQENVDTTAFDSCMANGGGVSECRNITSGTINLQAQGMKLFEDKIAELSTKMGTNVQLVTKLTKSINETKAVFVDRYNNPKPGAFGIPTDPKEIYLQALTAARDYNQGGERDTFCTNPGTADKQGCQVIEGFGLLLSKTIDPASKLGSPDTLTSAQQKFTASISSITPPSKCTSIITDFIGCLDVGFTWFIKTFLFRIAGFLLWMTANLLNYSMQIAIFQFKNFASNEVYTLWITVRQITSLCIFFAGMFIGFMAIIGKSEDFGRYIAALIVFGLFVNFSYPGTRVLVDLSNVVSLKVYSAALGSNILVADASSPNSAGTRIMRNLGLQGLVQSATDVENGKTAFAEKITSTPGALMAVIFVAYSAYVFWIMSVLIVVRAVMLNFIIIASPFLLIDTVVPLLGAKAQELRSIFFGQLMIAPVFTVMLAVTLRFLEIFNANKVLTGGDVLADASQAASVVVFFNLVMMLVMLHLMMKIVKQAAGAIGKVATEIANKGAQLGGGLAFGAAGLVGGGLGRQTIGRLANMAAKSDFVDRNAGGILGGLTKTGLTNLGSSSFDARGLKTTQALGGALGLKGMGTGAKTGYAQGRKEYEEEIAKRAADIKDDNARQQLLDRKFNGFGQQFNRAVYDKTGKRVGFDPNETADAKALNRITRAADEMLERYARASTAEQGRMKQAPENRQFAESFEKIDQLSKNNISADVKETIRAGFREPVQKALREREAKDEGIKDRVADYLTADKKTRESIYASSINDEALRKKLDNINLYRNVDNTAADAIAQKVKILQDLGDNTLAAKVIARDAHTDLTEAAAIAQKIELYKGMQVTGVDNGRVTAEYTAAMQKQKAEIAEQTAKQEEKQAAQQAQQNQADAIKTLAQQVAASAQGTTDLTNLLRQQLNTRKGRQGIKVAA